MILDWEIGALYKNCMQRHNGDESEALKRVREKYEDEFLKKDLHFFLGTTQQFHSYAPNPWLIIGVFPIPYERQMDLLDVRIPIEKDHSFQFKVITHSNGSDHL